MRKLSFIFLALALLLSLLPVAIPAQTAQAIDPVITAFPVPPYVKTPPVFRGMVTDADGDDIVSVEVMLKDETLPATYWDGTAWQTEQKYAADEAAFDPTSHLWMYPHPTAATTPDYTNNHQYTLLQLRATDDAAEEQVNPSTGVTFWYDTTAPGVGVGSLSGDASDMDSVSGSASDSTSPVVDVKVVIQRDLDDYYLNLDAGIWQECKAWNDANVEPSVPGNPKTVVWDLDTPDVPWYDGVTYSIWAMASDEAGNSAEPAADPNDEYECNRYASPSDALAIDMNGEESPPAYFVSTPTPICGSASSESDEGKTITAVKVKIERDWDEAWWDGDSWEDKYAATDKFIEAQASDFDDFNEDVEDWCYDDSDDITWEEGKSYTIDAMVEDSSPTVQRAHDIEKFTTDWTAPVAVVNEIASPTTAPAIIKGSASDTTPGEVASVQVQIKRVTTLPPATDYWNGLVWQNDEVWLYSTVTVKNFGERKYDWVLDTDPTWDAGRTYTITARAVDKAGNCGADDAKTFDCTGPPPYVPPVETPTATPTATTPPEEEPTPTATMTSSPGSSPTPTPSATPTTQVVIDVAAVKVDEDSEFTANVRLYRAQNFDSAQYQVKYDATVIEVTGVSDGSDGTTAIPVTSSSLVPAGQQGVFSIVNDVAGTAGLSGNMILAKITFHVIGAGGKTSDISFVAANSKLFDNTAPTPAEIPAGWKKDSVEVKSLAATPTPSATPTMTATPTTTPADDGGGGSPGWLWPLVGILIVLTLVFIGLALYKAGYLAKLGGMWGATEEDFLVDDMSDEDLYDAMYSGEEEEEL